MVMQLHEIIKISGCITQEHYIKYRSLRELELILGFREGRLEAGAAVVALLKAPGIDEFTLLGYTQVAEHRFNKAAAERLDVKKLKEQLLKDRFTSQGPKRLVKVITNTRENPKLTDDENYPPGWGIPQWKLTELVSARVVAIIKPGEVYN
jgi:hypothetical protein